MESGNINAAGRQVLRPPNGPVRVTAPLSTAVFATAPQAYYTCLPASFQGRRGGFLGVRPHGLYAVLSL